MNVIQLSLVFLRTIYLCCTPLTASSSSWWVGFQITMPYFRWEQTKELYSALMIFTSRDENDLLITTYFYYYSRRVFVGPKLTINQSTLIFLFKNVIKYIFALLILMPSILFSNIQTVTLFYIKGKLPFVRPIKQYTSPYLSALCYFTGKEYSTHSFSTIRMIQ